MKSCKAYLHMDSTPSSEAEVMINSRPYRSAFPVHIIVRGNVIDGELSVPRNAKGIVVFPDCSDGAENSRHLSQIASTLHKAAIGTLQVNLLTEDEQGESEEAGKISEDRLNKEIINDRLMTVIHWLWSHEQTSGLPIGLFGIDQGATTAFTVASRLSEELKALIVEGELKDILRRDLHMITAPTLLIADSRDDRYQDIFCGLCCEKKLEVIPEASQQLEEKSKAVASLATCWYRDHLLTRSLVT